MCQGIEFASILFWLYGIFFYLYLKTHQNFSFSTYIHIFNFNGPWLQTVGKQNLNTKCWIEENKIQPFHSHLWLFICLKEINVSSEGNKRILIVT